ncbi:MAG: multidrug efflux RND transporter permease subunit [Pseudomonadota bacterium]
MGIAHFCIERPIFATVLSLLIILVGAAAYLSLPVAQYPEIAPPTIQITASYPGASAEVVSQTVATPIEQEVNGVEGMLYMLSQATGDGQLTITVTFNLGTDLDAAQVLVQNRVARAESRLPEEVRRLGITVEKNSPDMLMVVHLYSPDGSRDPIYISNYATLSIRDVLARLDGVGTITVFGARDYAMRIWIDPEKAGQLDLTAGDVVQALRGQNVQVASGALNQPPVPTSGAFQVNVETLGRLSDPREFEQIVVKADPGGRLVRVGDVARVELGAASYNANGYLDERPAIPLLIFQRPGSNALATADLILETMADLSEDFPDGLAYTVVYNPTEFIEASVNAVYETLFEAVLLVVLVIIVFLQNWRAAIIPISAIPVSLIGTFAIMAMLGYSLNTLTLFALVLAIGIVVDDAIVVVENVERNLAKGLGSKRAAHHSMDEVGGALVASTLVLVAVFVPAAFITGITGQFFRQFAVVIAVSTGISLLVSLTLSPALAALLLRPHDEHAKAPLLLRPIAWLGRGFNSGFDALANAYGRLTARLVRVAVLVLVVYAGLLALTVDRFQAAPTGFIPEQDQGYLIVALQLPPGAALDRTDAVVRRLTDIVLNTEGIVHAVPFAGFDGATFTNAPNAGAIFAVLEPFEERQASGLSATAIQGELTAAFAAVQDAFIIVITPPPVRGVGNSGGFKMYVQDRQGRGLGALEEATGELIGAAFQDPSIAYAFTFFNTKTPTIFADIDRVRAEKLNLQAEEVFETLEVYLGSSFVNEFNFLGRTYRVTAQADGNFREDLDDVLLYEARNDEGVMVPLGAVASFQDQTGAYRVPRYNLYPAAELQGGLMPGISTGDGLLAMERLAERVLPSGFDFEWTELSLQEKLEGGGTIFVFIAAVTFVFLLLAAQYESWLLPLAVVLIVPMCLLAALFGLGYRGMEVGILAQVGFVVLIALAAKNAILIVEFAKQSEEQGCDRFDAAVVAARTRLRPILMTSFAFILGVLPLAVATGAGAEMRQSLGTTVFSGMIGVTLFGLIFTPIFYVICRSVASDVRGAKPVVPVET